MLASSIRCGCLTGSGGLAGTSPAGGGPGLTGTRARRTGLGSGGGLRRGRLACALTRGARDARGGMSGLLPGGLLGAGRRLGLGRGRARSALLIGVRSTTGLTTGQEHSGRGEDNEGQGDGEAASADRGGHDCGILSVEVGAANTVLEPRSEGEPSESQTWRQFPHQTTLLPSEPLDFVEITPITTR